MKQIKDKCCLLNFSYVENESGEICKGNDCPKAEQHNTSIMFLTFLSHI